MVTGALTAAVVVTGIGQCIVDELNATPESGGVPANMRIAYLVPGEIAWDSCECGQLALSIVRDFPTVTFPVDDSLNPVKGGCMTRTLGYEVTVSLTRCVPGPQKSGKPPTVESLYAAALVVEGDAWAVENGIACCLASLKNDRTILDYRYGGVRRVGPEGACAGVEATFYFQLA